MNVIVKHEGRTIAHSMVFKNENHPENAFMTHVSIYEDAFIFYRPLVTKYILNELQSRGYELVNFGLIPENGYELYSEFDFPQVQTIQFRKELD